MPENKIEPHRVTKPIQLLAAWLVGLIVVDGTFLTAANALQSPPWISPLLVIASVVNVPLFLICIFVLQTKYRPEMQEDTFYSKYIHKRLTDRRDSEISQSQLAVVKAEERLATMEENYQKVLETLNIEASQLRLLNNAHELLNEASRVETVERVAHEVKSRLQAIIANIENFQSDIQEYSLSQREVSQRCREVLSSAFALNTVVESSRYISQNSYSFKVQKISDLLLEARQIYQAEAAARSIDVLIDIELSDEGLLQIEMSRYHLQVAINNLTHNAIKYSLRKGIDSSNNVRISCRPAGAFYLIAFENYGVGMLPNEIENSDIFKYGYKGQLTHGEYRMGVGTGLYFVKNVIDRHHGRIEVRSNVTTAFGKELEGQIYQNRFEVYLPYKQPDSSLT